MYIQRNLEKTIEKYLDSPEILAIVGPRQAGKTTMLKSVFTRFPEAVSISFDDRSILELFEKNPDSFIAAYVNKKKFLFIDEFHYARAGGKVLKYIFDKQTALGTKTKIVISGSSAPDITVKAMKYLVGRILIFELYPFDFSEFLEVRDINIKRAYEEYFLGANPYAARHSVEESGLHERFVNLYEEYLRFGGYPRVVLEESEEVKKEILRNIYNTFFLREVKDIVGLIDDYKLNNLAKGLALQIGNLIDYSELSHLSDYSFASVKKFLNFLEKTYICRPVRPFFNNKRTEIVKSPKVYFFDTGLRNAAINDFRVPKDRTDKGALLENGMAMQFVKKGIEFNFWRDKQKHEVDFILSLEGRRVLGVESKYQLRSGSASIKSFQKSHPEIPLLTSYLQKDKAMNNNPNTYPAYLF